MKKLIAMLVIGGFLAAGLVGCGPTPSTEPPKGGMPMGETSVKGKAKDDATATKVTVTTADKDVDVTLTDSTKFTGDAKAATDIKKGWSVDATVKDGKATTVDGKKP
jgi:hypothetical protein